MHSQNIAISPNGDELKDGILKENMGISAG